MLVLIVLLKLPYQEVRRTTSTIINISLSIYHVAPKKRMQPRKLFYKKENMWTRHVCLHKCIRVLLMFNNISSKIAQLRIALNLNLLYIVSHCHGT